MPKRWEYKVDFRTGPDTQDWLNALGVEGWELVDILRTRDGHVISGTFKRPKA